MQTVPDKNIPEDEIDLGRAWKKFRRIITYPFRLLASHPIVTLLFIIAGLLVCVTIKSVVPFTYTSSFIIRPNDPKEKFHLRILGDIQALLKNQDIQAVAEQLKISEELASRIGGLKTYHPVLKNSPDSVNYTEVSIVTTDYNLFLPIQNAIISYLEDNPYFTKIRTLQERQVNLHMEQVNKDLALLDSLKKLQLKNYAQEKAGTPNTLLLSDVVNPMTTYTMAVERLNRKTNLIAQQVFNSSFELIKGCVILKRHTFPPRIFVMCLYIVPFFLLLCFIILHFMAEHKRAKSKQ